MPDPKILDFSAGEEDAITIVFPDGKTSCELPTVDELSMSALQFLAANGDEWQTLFQKPILTDEERKRFDHINENLVRALCSGVPEDQIDALSVRMKARIILSFITASPNFMESAVMAEAQTPAGKE